MPGIHITLPLYRIPLAIGQPSVDIGIVTARRALILGEYGCWYQHQGYCQHQSKQNTDDFQIVTSILSFAFKGSTTLCQTILQCQNVFVNRVAGS